jgi:hypothetical protein
MNWLNNSWVNSITQLLEILFRVTPRIKSDNNDYAQENYETIIKRGPHLKFMNCRKKIISVDEIRMQDKLQTSSLFLVVMMWMCPASNKFSCH